TKAVKILSDYGLYKLGFARIHTGVYEYNPASQRVLEKCGFQWSGVGLYRFHAINSSAPCDRFRLERDIWESLKNWGAVRVV
ncbi:MAG: GNAT family N-acetyltransferase, partial [Xanthobacteraceae bacterium]